MTVWIRSGVTIRLVRTHAFDCRAAELATHWTLKAAIVTMVIHWFNNWNVFDFILLLKRLVDLLHILSSVQWIQTIHITISTNLRLYGSFEYEKRVTLIAIWKRVRKKTKEQKRKKKSKRVPAMTHRELHFIISRILTIPIHFWPKNIFHQMMSVRWADTIA